MRPDDRHQKPVNGSRATSELEPVTRTLGTKQALEYAQISNRPELGDPGQRGIAATEQTGDNAMRINDPKARYSQVSGVFLDTDQAQDHRLLVMAKMGSLKVVDGMVTFKAMVPESAIESLYVPPSERLRNR
ncbi:hypothetical protein BST37_18725 [Mycobacterium noviomagense]|uniref:Uncharacterized protein n=1 Tax=Mycobacterium noviomagense TaxID=459858 RepID=A0ABX3T1K7_9MYCO|nr:hypothetical protein BST37_18725 [Mycobacterium noviomagense]